MRQLQAGNAARLALANPVGSNAGIDQVPVADFDSVPVGVLEAAVISDREGRVLRFEDEDAIFAALRDGLVDRFPGLDGKSEMMIFLRCRGFVFAAADELEDLLRSPSGFRH